MSLDIRTQQIPASGTVRIGQGNFIFLITSANNVNLTIQYNGAQTDYFTGVIAGVKIQRVKPWQYVDIAGPAGTVLQYMFGYENVKEDDVNIQQALATIAGTVATAALPSAALATPAQSTLVNGTFNTIAANLSRRRITIGCLSTSPVAIRVSAAGATLTGIEIQPGVFVEFDTVASLCVRNDTATTGAIYYTMEET